MHVTYKNMSIHQRSTAAPETMVLRKPIHTNYSSTKNRVAKFTGRSKKMFWLDLKQSLFGNKFLASWNTLVSF